MRLGMLGMNTVVQRSEKMKEIMCREGTSEDERETLSKYLKIEKFTNYFVRFSILPLLVILYRRKFFDKPSPMFKRELLLVAGCLGFIGAADYGVNEYVWTSTEPIIKKYSRHYDAYYMDDKSIEKLKGERRMSDTVNEEEKLYE
eukprot:TRINITY_DN5065_c0_g1_i1.p3 TRINITY_DN5065_c0_g1~~TRINITY_DN5065_c0_g1_i1.p3  ORF type:complete len:145 (-),score=39.32 TRINITY_DN5065_c0_g1_i1:239-673(-)